MTTTKTPKPSFDSSGNLIVTLDRTYTFRAPKGRDLATIQRAMTTEMVSVEATAVTLSALSVDGITFDAFLDLDGDILLDLEAAVTSNFRVFRKVSV